MLWTNKTWTTKRLNGYYIDNLSNYKFRFERISHFSSKIYVWMENHIIYKLFSDNADIIVSDRLVCSGKEYVFIGVMPHEDSLGSHLECFIRQIWPSQFHQEVLLMKLDSAQPEYDEILNEFKDNWKQYSEVPCSMIIDPINKLSWTYIKLLDMWKIEDLDYVAIVDKPTKVINTDYVRFNWFDYDLKFINEYPFQTIIWLKKTVLNYKIKEDE